MAGKRLTPIARKLRRDVTDAERRLWSRLRSRPLGAQFTRQFPIGQYVADFGCRRLKLVVELDGGQHAESATDEQRARVIEAHGYQVIRFWNNDVLQNTEGVLQRIIEEMDLARNRT